MSDLAASMRASDMHGHSPGVVLRSLVIGLTAFLTVVDLFATQAILPSLTRHYGVTPGEWPCMSLALIDAARSLMGLFPKRRGDVTLRACGATRDSRNVTSR